MNTIRYFTALTSVIALAACSNEEFDSDVFNSDPNAVLITATIGDLTQTRSNPVGATESDRTRFNAGDRISVKAEGQDAVTYTLRMEDAVWTPDAGKYLKWNATSEIFSAYYPADTYDGTQTTVPTDQHEEEHIAQADYMKCEAVVRYKSEGTVQLPMQRQTARVVISEINWGEQYGSDMQHIFDITLADGVSGDITPYKSGDGKYYALLMPGNGTTDETFIKITIGDGNTEDSKENLTVKDIPVLEAGYSYTCTLKIGKDKASISSVEVTDWQTGYIIENNNEGTTEEYFGYTVTIDENGVATYTVEELRGLMNLNVLMTTDVTEEKMKSNITLGGRFTLTGENNWTPIGTENLPYNGTFNGNNLPITGLHIESDSEYQGLFGCIGKDGVVRSTWLYNCHVSGKAHVGGIVGKNEGTIEDSNVQTTSSNTLLIKASEQNAGIIAGSNLGGTITGCWMTAYSTSKMTVEANDAETSRNAGGVVGYNGDGGVITQCFIWSLGEGAISVNASVSAGGVVGYNENGEVSGSGSYNEDNGTILITAGSNVGGVAGRNGNGTTYTGNVIACLVFRTSVAGKNNVGGIVGWNGYAGQMVRVILTLLN